MRNKKRKERNQIKGETKIKLSKKTISLGYTQADSKLRQSIPSVRGNIYGLSMKFQVYLLNKLGTNYCGH